MKSLEAKLFAVALATVVLLVCLVLVLKEPNSGAQPGEVKSFNGLGVTREELVPAGSHRKGESKAQTTIVVFSDFECPLCKTGAVELDRIFAQMGGRVSLVFRHCQAAPDHARTRVLARAAECAGKQGRFWQMHDILFERQSELAAAMTPEEITDGIRAAAKSAGVEVEQFDRDMAAKDDTSFDRDNDLGRKLGIRGTPTFVVLPPDGNVVLYRSIAQIRTWAAENRN